MKNLTIIISLLCVLFFSISTFAQFDIDLEKKIEKKVNKEINKAADDAIDETTETIKKGEGDGVDPGKVETPGNEDNTTTDVNTNVETDVTQATVDNQPVEELKLWSKYDFVAGDKIIFEDDLSSEESGEFPSRWDLLSGSAEIALLGEVNVIHLTHNNSIVLPLMVKKDFLTDVFTFEFDAYFEKDATTRTEVYKIRFFEGIHNSTNIDGKSISPIDISWNSVKMGQFGGYTTGYEDEKKSWNGKWKHIAISFNKRSLNYIWMKNVYLTFRILALNQRCFPSGHILISVS